MSANGTELRREVRVLLALNDRTLADVAREAGLAYDRVVRVVNGIRAPRPGEVEAILAAIRADRATTR